jgi:hypothetical protein
MIMTREEIKAMVGSILIGYDDDISNALGDTDNFPDINETLEELTDIAEHHIKHAWERYNQSMESQSVRNA